MVIRLRSDLQRYFADCFGNAIAPLGFRSAESMLFERQRSSIRDIVAAGPRPAGKGFALSMGSVGLLLPEVERQRVELELPRRNATVSIGLHLLLPGMHFREWTVSTSSDIDRLLPQLLDALREVGLPFLETFEGMEDVQRRLQEPQPRSWFMCSQDDRGVNLVLIEAVQRGPIAALRLCEHLLSELDDMPPKYSHELRRLRVNLNGHVA